MVVMEERLRTSLRERVRDVATQPALYRRVQERADRRRRRRRLAAVPAGLAVLGVAVAAPLLVQGGPDVPRIEDTAEQLTAGTGPNAPTELVVVRDGMVERWDLATDRVESPLGMVTADRFAMANPGEVVDEDRMVTALMAPPAPTFTRLFGGVGAGEVGLDADGDGGVAVSPDGRWTAVLGVGDRLVDLHTLSNLEMDGDADLDGTAGVSLPAGSILQDWTSGAQPGTTAVIVRTAQGQLRTFELQEGDDGASLRAAPDQTDLAALLPTTVLATASSHLEPDDALGGPVYSLVPVADGVQLRVTEAGAITAERDVSALLGDTPTADVWLDAWGDVVLFGDGQRTWLVARSAGGDLLAPRALPEGVTRAAPVAQEIVTPEVAAVPGDPAHALLVLDDGTLVADDLSTGERTELHPPVNRNMTVHSFTVSVGATIDDFVAAGYDDGASDDLGLVTYVRRDGGEVVAALTRSQELPGWANNRAPYAVSPDGRWIAYLARSGDDAVTQLVPIDPMTAELAVDEAQMLEGGSLFLQDWSGAVAEVGDRSRIVGGRAGGELIEQTLERTEAGFVLRGTTELTPATRAAEDEDVHAWAAFTSQRPGQADDPRFEVVVDLTGSDERMPDAALLRYVVGDEVLAERKLPFGARLGNLSLAARGGTALVVADQVSGTGEPAAGGRAIVARVATSADDGYELLVPQVLADGPVVGALLGGLSGD